MMLHVTSSVDNMADSSCPLLSNMSPLESWEDSSSKLSLSRTESTCTSLSLTSKSKYECFETDEKRSRKRCKVIKCKRPRGLKYQKGLAICKSKNNRFPDPFADAGQKTSFNMETTKVAMDGVLYTAETNPTVLEEDQGPYESDSQTDQAVNNNDEKDDNECCSVAWDSFSSKENSSALILMRCH